MSAGDRWAYTLYLRPSGAPFVHALDTVHRRAVCVDLPSTLGADISAGYLRFTGGGGTLEVLVDGVGTAQINTRTFAVTTGAAQATSVRIRPASTKRGESDSLPWGFIALGILALSALAVVVTCRCWPRRTLDDPHAPGSSELVPPGLDDSSPERDRQSAAARLTCPHRLNP
jgi:hypothetical protein